MAESVLQIVRSAGTEKNIVDDDEKKIIAAARELATQKDGETDEGSFDWSTAGVNHRRASRKK